MHEAMPMPYVHHSATLLKSTYPAAPSMSAMCRIEGAVVAIVKFTSVRMFI